MTNHPYENATHAEIEELKKLAADVHRRVLYIERLMKAYAAGASRDTIDHLLQQTLPRVTVIGGDV